MPRRKQEGFHGQDKIVNLRLDFLEIYSFKYFLPKTLDYIDNNNYINAQRFKYNNNGKYLISYGIWFRKKKKFFLSSTYL